jgi:succinyl-CoA synthetase alpha subunit/L-amino acid N-acyltransferase YncA
MMEVAYPGHREVDVALRDGSTVHMRPVRATDAPAVRAFFERLSPESTGLRFFSGFPNLDSAVSWATEVDDQRRYSLVATSGDGRVLAHAGWDRELGRPERAEVALAIADAMQGKGLGTILLGQLAEAADQAGIGTLDAEVLPHNHKMIKVFRDSGFPVETHAVPGVVLVEVSTSLTPEGLERFERREQTAAAAAMRVFLAPRSVAVVGASRRRGTVGAELFHNLLAGGFNGPVYPVNPNAAVVQSVVAYPSIADVPGPVDLAVLAVPAAAVVRTAEECAAARVRALIVLSAGFAETGPEGAQRQAQLLRVCREAGMRLIGPNCLGIVNTNPNVRLDATFGPAMPLAGRVGFLSQSGALGLAVVNYATKLGLGLSSFVSVGNKADISSNDLLDYWEQDPDTSVALLYLESFGNPRRFSRIARRVGRRKPVVAVKSGRSAGRGQGQLLAHRGAAGRLRRDRGRAVPAGRGDPHRHPARAVRRRRPAGQPAPAQGPAGRDRDQRRRAGGPVRRRLPGRRPAGGRALGGVAGQAGRGPAGGRVGRQPGRHAGGGAGRALPAHGRVGWSPPARSTRPSSSSSHRC